MRKFGTTRNVNKNLYLRFWYNSLTNEEQQLKTHFGCPLHRAKVRLLLITMFDPFSVSFESTPDVQLENELAIRNAELARWTPSGWRFHAGETWKARQHIWNLVSRTDTQVLKIVQSGWEPEFQGNIRPAWFANPKQTDDAMEQLQIQHDTLFIMEAVKHVDENWVARNGFPSVVMHFFLVFQDPEKGWRPIGSAIHLNLIFEPGWFPLPSAPRLRRIPG